MVHSDAAGHILVAGSAALADGSRSAVVMRFLSTGQIDTNWGDRGQAMLPEGRGASVATDVLPGADGSVLVVGAVEDNGSQRASIWRIAIPGHADRLFGRQGVMLAAPLPQSQVLSVQQGTSGALQLAVQTFEGGTSWIEMHRWAAGDAVPRRVARQEFPQQWVGPATLVLQRGQWFWIDPSRPENPVAVVLLKDPDSPWSRMDPRPVLAAEAPHAQDRAAMSAHAVTAVAEQSNSTQWASMTNWLGMAAAGLLVAGAVVWRSS